MSSMCADVQLSNAVVADPDQGEGKNGSEKADDLLRQYCREAGRRPLLGASEERMLARRIEGGVKAEERLEQAAKQGETMPEATRRELEQRVRRGKEARERFIESNLRLVISEAKRYKNQGLDPLDLIQAGNIGLMHAVDRFDYRRGYKFCTYAIPFIQHDVLRAVDNLGRAVRNPVYIADEARKIRNARNSLPGILMREPSAAEVAAEVGISVERLGENDRATAKIESLDQPIDRDGELTYRDPADRDSFADPYRCACRNMGMEEFGKLRVEMNELPDRERRALVLYYGLDGEEPITDAEIAEELGVSRQRAQQIRAQGLAKLRTSPHAVNARDLLLRG